MDNETAVRRLNLLLGEAGALMIPTPFHACVDGSAEAFGTPGNQYDSEPALMRDADFAAHPSSKASEACRAYAKEHRHAEGLNGGYRTVHHYLLAPVARLEEVEGSQTGRYTAYADDAANTQISGQPAALLTRLTEHEQG